jgi:hypothetical protein
MKKFVFFVGIALLAAGTVVAQNWGSPEPVMVSGTLQLMNGQIVLSGGGNTFYYVPALTRLIGFVDGLREGAQVNVEGFSLGGGFLQLTKFTIGGRDYDLSANVSGWGGSYGYCPTWGGGWCGGSGRRGGYGRGRW